MISTIILGLGLPSAVCYLLMATLVGPVLTKMGVVPLAAHLFIFYFGLMSMVTPPVALAAYTAAAIAKANIMRTSLAAFRFALVGFMLPYAFVLNPSLLLISTDGAGVAGPALKSLAFVLGGILYLAVSTVGYAFRPVRPLSRLALFIASFMLILIPGSDTLQLLCKGAAAVTGLIIICLNALHAHRGVNADEASALISPANTVGELRS